MTGQVSGTDVVEEVSDDDSSADEQFYHSVSQPPAACTLSDSPTLPYAQFNEGTVIE